MRKRLSLNEYESGILSGDRIILSRAITLLESKLESDIELSEELLNRILPKTGDSVRLGITGVPGVGKSTFIEAFGEIVTKNHQLAVVAIDPSSQISRGSIMGDKTRMETLVRNPKAYIRPSVSGDSLGGVASKTRETILLLEAAGYDFIIVETVGVGQSETVVHGMVDFFLLLMLAGAGDELQGIKRGIMEMADSLVINKADGDNVIAAKRALAEYQAALHLFPPKENSWQPKVMTSSAVQKTGLKEILGAIESFRKHTMDNGHFRKNRNSQNIQWMYENVDRSLKHNFYNTLKWSEKCKNSNRKF